MTDQSELRPWEDLRTSGLLWLINRVVFHPRGFALGLASDSEGAATGWLLLGDGSEPWWFADDSADLFSAAQQTLTPKDGTRG